MPNRIIKESLCSSEKIASLSDFEFRLWIGLIVSADDAGRGDARPAIIKGHVFPFRERVTVKDISAALHGLAAKGCVSLYDVDGKPYFWFPTWKDHQRVRDCRTKYPEPPEISQDCQSAASCGELPQVAASCGELPLESESESESESKDNKKTNTDAQARKKFEPPTLEDVEAYCAGRHSIVDAKSFYEYFTEGDWHDSEGKPVHNWKQKVLTWEKFNIAKAPERGNIRGHSGTSAAGNQGKSGRPHIPGKPLD